MRDHIHISEREADGSWEDCTWDSGLEWYRLCFDPSKPATHTEAQKLRAASGEPPTGGSNLTNLKDGLEERYDAEGLPPLIAGFAALKRDLKPGTAAVIQGSMSAFGPLHRLSKWDRNFDGAHAVMLACLPNGSLLWCDPEAPNPPGPSYQGVSASWTEVEQFVKAFNGQHIVAPILEFIPPEADMEPIVTYTPGFTAFIKPVSNIRKSPHVAAEKFRTVAAAGENRVIIGTVKGDVDPKNGSNIWYMWWAAKSERYEFTAKDNIGSLTPPATGTTDCSALEAQNAAQAAEVTRLTALVEAQKVTLDVAAPKAEKFDIIKGAVSLLTD